MSSKLLREIINLYKDNIDSLTLLTKDPKYKDNGKLKNLINEFDNKLEYYQDMELQNNISLNHTIYGGLLVGLMIATIQLMGNTLFEFFGVWGYGVALMMCTIVLIYLGVAWHKYNKRIAEE